MNQQERSMLTLEEAARFLGISKSYLYKLTHGLVIPHYKPGGKLIYFQCEDLEAWMRRNRISSKDELANQAESMCMAKRRTI